MTQKRMAFLKELLNFVGIHPDRLNLTWVSSSEAPQFAEAVTGFIRRIQELGPSSLKVPGNQRFSPGPGERD